MKKPIVIAIIYAIFLFPSFCSFAEGDFSLQANEPLYGTWVNDKMFPAKMVKLPDGIDSDYWPSTSSTPFRSAASKYVAKWTDSDGNAYYNSIDTFTSGDIKGHIVYCLWKVSADGKSMEMNWREFAGEFLKEINHKSNYFIFYRAQE